MELYRKISSILPSVGSSPKDLGIQREATMHETCIALSQVKPGPDPKGYPKEPYDRFCNVRHHRLI